MDPHTGGYTSSASPTDEYLYFDPRSRNAQKPTRGQTFNESIVFMIGGGNYVEYGNLLDWTNRQITQGKEKRIIYGATEIVTPSAFIKELSKS